MPRQRKTMSGAKAQPLSTTPAAYYGQGVENRQMQRAMPAPQATRPAARPQPAGRTQPAQPAPQTPQPQQAPPAPPAPDFGALLAAAGGLKNHTGLLTAETLRPNEPITAGLTRGPGPGPKALTQRTGTPSGDLFRRLTELTGDASFAELARKVGV